MKIKKQYKNLKTYKIVLLSLLISAILVSIVLISFAYYSQNKLVTGTITLGELDFSISCSTSSSTIMPGDEVPLNLKIINSRNVQKTNTSNLIPFFVRASFFNEIENVEVNFASPIVNSNWTYQDGYYYYLGTVDVGNEVCLCDFLSISVDIENLNQNENLELYLQVDAIQCTREAVENNWTNLPQSFVNILNLY